MELYPQHFDFHGFLRDVCEICQIRAEEKGLDFEYEPSPDLPKGIYADEKRLRQVLINLLGNAIKFTDFGSVSLKVNCLDCPLDIDATCKIHFEIQDTGIGMSDTLIGKIFLPFEQVGDRQKMAEGTGLGLAISQKIVKAMGGELVVKSKTNFGSSFSMDLELKTSNEWILTQPKQPTIIGCNQKGIKILVVDDIADNRTIIHNFIEPLGFEVFTAINGRDGLDKVREINPSLIITDLLMPVMDGFEFIKQLKLLFEQKSDLHTKSNHIPIIASSASVFEADQKHSIQVGADSFLAKPVQVDDLMQLLQLHLKVEWIYAKASDINRHSFSATSKDPNLNLAKLKENIVSPPFEVLQHLTELARRGNLRELTKQADLLEVEFSDFAQQIRQMAKSYQEQELFKFINQFQVN